jgi:hypothetical protein
MVTGTYGVGDQSAGGQCLFHRARVPLGSVDGQAEPERQTAGAAAEVEGQVRRIVGIAVDGVEIVVARDAEDLHRVTNLLLEASGVVRSTTTIVLLEVQSFSVRSLLERHAGS